MKNKYQIVFDEDFYRELCAEYNRRKRAYRRREIISKILIGISMPIIVISFIFIPSLLFFNYTPIEKWVVFWIVIFGSLCSFLGYHIDPENNRVQDLKEEE